MGDDAVCFVVNIRCADSNGFFRLMPTTDCVAYVTDIDRVTELQCELRQTSHSSPV
jgi:hypothetical protein